MIFTIRLDPNSDIFNGIRQRTDRDTVQVVHIQASGQAHNPFKGGEIRNPFDGGCYLGYDT